MAANKTQATEMSVADFLAAVEPAQRRDDARAVCDMLARVSGEPARMWEPAIVGFGTYHYRYDSGREGEMCRIGFSPRKAQTVLYIPGGFPRYEDLLARLGKHSTGKGCLYIKKLANVDTAVLEILAGEAFDYMRTAYP
ncbi:DUF1801 domain-containing protein [Sphingomonas qilianensis]